MLVRRRWLDELIIVWIVEIIGISWRRVVGGVWGWCGGAWRFREIHDDIIIQQFFTVAQSEARAQATVSRYHPMWHFPRPPPRVPFNGICTTTIVTHKKLASTIQHRKLDWLHYCEKIMNIFRDSTIYTIHLPVSKQQCECGYNNGNFMLVNGIPIRWDVNTFEIASESLKPFPLNWI